MRPGGLPAEVLEEALGAPLELGGNAEAPNAPGQLSSHYAPGAAVRLGAREVGADEVWIGFGPGCAGADLSLSATEDLVEAAANLFSALRAADQLASERRARGIAVAPIPEHGLGRAINDRLRRAAAPRP